MKKFVIAVAGIWFGSGSVHAATYNFYFNGTEQGANSQATPTVVVGETEEDGKKGESETSASAQEGTSEAAAAETATAEQGTPAAATVTPASEERAVPGTAVSQAEVTAPKLLDPEDDFPRWRIGGSASAQLVFPARGDLGPGFHASYHPTQGLGIGAYFMQSVIPSWGGEVLPTGGVEFVWTPIHPKAWDIPDFFRWGFLLGVTMGGVSTWTDFFYKKTSTFFVAAHGGTFLSIAFGRHWELDVTVRASWQHAQANVGLTYRL